MGVRNITLFKIIFKGSFRCKYAVCLKNQDNIEDIEQIWEGQT